MAGVEDHSHEPQQGRSKIGRADDNSGVSSNKRAKTGDTLPDLFVKPDEQTSEIQKLIKSHGETFKKILRLDSGISSAKNWTYKKRR
jgi:hypothetical protein